MAGRCSPGGGPGGVISSRSATKELFATPNSDSFGSDQRSFSFPKERRLRKSGDFRRVYQNGFRVPGRYFQAICLVRTEPGGPRVGFSVPRALGGAVVRNRIKRLMRESVRRHIQKLDSSWDVVFQPRAAALKATVVQLDWEVEKVFARCSAS